MSEHEVAKAVIPSETGHGSRPDARQRKAIDKAVEFYRSKPEPHRTRVEVTGRRKMKVSPPHSDVGGYFCTLNKTFGTAPVDFSQGCQGWLANIVTRSGSEGPTEPDLNAALAAVGGIEPRDEAEAMLAVQMVATFETAMSMLGTAKHADLVDHSEKYGNLAVKMMRTYTAQVEALAKLRRKGEQTVRVEHVHVYPGGQAIVGQVTTGGTGTGGGQLENGHQPYGPDDVRALALASSPPMLCPDPTRDGMPVASNAGQDAMPDTRRRSRKRRTEGSAER